MEFIASAPTFYSGNKAQPALEILEKYELLDRLPFTLLEYLKSQAQLKDETAQFVHVQADLHFLEHLALESLPRNIFKICLLETIAGLWKRPLNFVITRSTVLR